MNPEKDIRFTEKKVDESWKDDIAKEQRISKEAPSSRPSHPEPQPKGKDRARVQEEEVPGDAHPESSPFITLISSLGMQAMIQLGMVEDPGTQMAGVDLAGARVTIELLAMLKEKTQGNLIPQESRLLDGLLYDLQMKFVAQAKTSDALGRNPSAS